MFNLFRKTPDKKSLKIARTPEYRARPQLETLEDRTVPTVTYHGGNLLEAVQVQGVYLGNEWYNATYLNQAYFFEGYLNTLVNSSFMDALTKAGYGVGRGSYSNGRVINVNLDPSTFLDDSTIQADVQNAISNGTLQAPNPDRLYVVFVEPNINVTAFGANSIYDFLGYHGAYAGNDKNGIAADIRYAVIPYHGLNSNAQIPWLGILDSMTVVTSHEVAEASTDPDVNYGTRQ